VDLVQYFSWVYLIIKLTFTFSVKLNVVVAVVSPFGLQPFSGVTPVTEFQ